MHYGLKNFFSEMVFGVKVYRFIHYMQKRFLLEHIFLNTKSRTSIAINLISVY